MAIHSSILTWRIPRTEEPGGLQSMGSHRVGHDWATNTFTFILSLRDQCHAKHTECTQVSIRQNNSIYYALPLSQGHTSIPSLCLTGDTWVTCGSLDHLPTHVVGEGQRQGLTLGLSGSKVMLCCALLVLRLTPFPESPGTTHSWLTSLNPAGRAIQSSWFWSFRQNSQGDHQLLLLKLPLQSLVPWVGSSILPSLYLLRWYTVAMTAMIIIITSRADSLGLQNSLCSQGAHIRGEQSESF